MIVPVDANALAGVGRCGTGDGAGPREELNAAAEDEGSVVGGRLGKMGHGALEGAKGQGELGVDAVGVGNEVGRGEGLGEEVRVVGRGGEGNMHLGGAPAEQGRGIEIKCGMFAGQ